MTEMSTKAVFALALQEMGDRRVSIPEAFSEYLRRNGMSRAKRTPEFVSVDAVEGLRPELRAAETMVLRLGLGTFCLVRSPRGMGEFFLDHEVVFHSSTAETFLPDVSWLSLLPFKLLPKLSEASLVNLGLASGLFGRALCLDSPERVHVPATLQSSFTFNFLPFEDAVQTLTHDRGQVEIDGIFVAKRRGRPTLFVIEAKTGSGVKSIAKHKLVYPVLALASRVPTSLDIVPIYVYAYENGEGTHFHVVECEFPDPRSGVSVLTSLTAVTHRHLTLPPGFGT